MQHFWNFCSNVAVVFVSAPVLEFLLQDHSLDDYFWMVLVEILGWTIELFSLIMRDE